MYILLLGKSRIFTDKIPITIPKVATIKLGHDEIERLIRYIKEA